MALFGTPHCTPAPLPVAVPSVLHSSPDKSKANAATSQSSSAPVHVSISLHQPGDPVGSAGGLLAVRIKPYNEVGREGYRSPEGCRQKQRQATTQRCACLQLEAVRNRCGLSTFLRGLIEILLSEFSMGLGMKPCNQVDWVDLYIVPF